MAEKEGFVTVFEASDAGSGKPEETTWQFFVDDQPVNTLNSRLAETMRLAVETTSKVRVTYDAATNTMSQARLAFRYEPQSIRTEPRDPTHP